jgi:hypothetical protein
MKKFLAMASILALTLGLAGCGVNPDRAKSALEAQGLTNVQIGGYAFWGCGENDTFRSSFTATGANGQQVSGVVCSAWFKGMTVRYD